MTNMEVKAGLVIATLFAATALTTQAHAHFGKCGEPGLPACADGWMSDEMRRLQQKRAAGEAPGSDEDAARVNVPGQVGSLTSGALNGPQGGCVLPEGATELEMRAWCNELVAQGLLDEDPTNACAGWLSPLTAGVLPATADAEVTDAACDPVIEARLEEKPTTADTSGDAPAISGGGWTDNFDRLSVYHPEKNPNGMWRHSDRWGDPTHPGYIDFAADKTININPGNAADGYQPLSVKDGVMTITARRIKDGSLNGLTDLQKAHQGVNPDVTWTGAWITTQDESTDVRPGEYVEARVRVSPGVPGVGGAFWLYTADQKTCAACEIDIADITGGGGRVETNVHNGHTLASTVWDGISHDEWHTYGLKRNGADSVTTYLDGKPQRTYETPGFNVPMKPIFSLAGDVYNRVPANVDKIEMQVDHVRKGRP